MTSPNVQPQSAPRRRPIAFATIAALLFVLPAAPHLKQPHMPPLDR